MQVIRGIAAVGAACVLACGGRQSSSQSPDPLRHVAPDLGFTLSVPSADWSCSQGNTHGYQCLPKGGDPFFSAFSVMVSDPDPKPFNRDQFIQGSLAGARQRGWKTHALTVEDSKIPFAGATHFTFLSEPSENGPRCILASYVGRDDKGRVITFMHLARGTSEPTEFSQFVASFRPSS